jgi:hypothetical protein
MQFMIIPENKNARISNLFPHGNQQPQAAPSIFPLITGILYLRKSL